MRMGTTKRMAMVCLVWGILSAEALVAPAARCSRKTVRMSSASEVSIAATQQLLSLGAVAMVEGVWSTTYNGFTIGKAARYMGPAALTAVVLVGASGSVSSGEAASMAPGLAASTAATLGLCVSYGLRLQKSDPDGPPKEAISLALVLAFFGFSTALQSIFAAGVVELPSLPSPDLGVPEAFPDMSEGVSSFDAASVAVTTASDPVL